VEPALQDILTRCYASTKFSAKALFPERFELPFSGLHDKIFEAIDGPWQKVVIIAPRGFGKTTIDNIAFPGKNILFREKRFIVPISSTATQAVLQSENLKRELMSNQLVMKMFGSVKSSLYDNQFSKEMWIAQLNDDPIGTCIMPRGAGQQVRGILFNRFRPDLIIVDDLEDKKSVQNEELRKEMKRWFFSDVMNSIDRGKHAWKVVVIGTLLHEDSLLSNLMEDPTWHHVHLSMCNDKYESNWPEFISNKEILELVESHRSQGILDEFYQEYMGVPQSQEAARFKTDYFKYYDNDHELNRNEDVESIVICDPAKTTEAKSDPTSIVGIGVDIINARIYIREIISAKLHPDEMYEEVFAMAKRVKARVVGLKVTTLNEFITYPFKQAMMQKGINLEIIEIKERAKKNERIAMLVPFYRRGLIYHNKMNCAGLEMQLLSFPRSKHDDIMDCAADIIPMLDEGERFFPPEEKPRDGDTGRPEDDMEMSEDDEYDEYAEQMSASGRWRMI
jgi:predicted phage terminase large subunit-like protein